MATGATIAPVPIQTGMTALDVAGRLEQAKTKLLITDADMLSMAEGASVLAGCISIITLDQADKSTPCIEDLIEIGDPSISHFEIRDPQEAETHNAFINRTSGSTGKMKSVVTTHAHYIATMEATRRTIPPNTDPDRDQWLSSLSLGFFINAKLHMSLNVLLGIPVVMMDQPFDQESISIIKRHAITFLFLTPPIAAKLAKLDIPSSDLSSVKWLLSAGAPMHANLREAVSAKFSGTHLTLEWGTSETMLIAIQMDEQSRRPGSSGTLVNAVQAKVIDTESGDELAPNEEGELLVRNSIARYAGYKDNDVANQAFDSEGWFHTGDYGFLDDSCNVYIVDRLKELLRVGDGYGSHVSAAELETVVFDHPIVASVVVVGVHNDRTQVDEPTAFVVLKPDFQAKAGRELAAEIEKFAARKLVGLKRLTGGVYFVPKYPTVGFKIDRRALKEMAKIKPYAQPLSSMVVPPS
jgi:4-coumarate--CoA ligase